MHILISLLSVFLFQTTTFGTEHKKEFYISNVTTTWDEAIKICSKDGGRLATILNEKEHQQARDLLNKNYKKIRAYVYFIGGTDETCEGKWFWLDHTPITFTPWNVYQPDGCEEENCLTYAAQSAKGFLWHDYSCSGKHYFICEVNKPVS